MSHTQLTGRVFLADDDSGILALLSTLCEDIGLETRSVNNGVALLEAVTEWTPDIILLDAMMPGKDGFQTTEKLKANPAFKRIPVIMLTGLRSREDRLKGIRAGVDDFLTKPIDAEELTLRVQNHLKIKEYGDFLVKHNEILEHQVAERTQQIQDSHEDTIYRLAAVSEYKDEDTGAHIRRISYYARELARALGLDDKYQATIFHAASMHDIGKVGIPDHIMYKKGALDEVEWDIMRSHTILGARILEGSSSPYLQMGEKIAMFHHERWDGTGYPQGTTGDAIPVSARITTIADQYDALRSQRPYKQPFSHEESIDIILN
jgi:putative two-component system response regulator